MIYGILKESLKLNILSELRKEKILVRLVFVSVLTCTKVVFSQTSYFDRYLPNYFTFAYQEDEVYSEFLVSLRYPRLTEIKTKRPPHEFFGTYTGLYDFFVFTRPSSPVLSRLQNVGLHSRWNFQNVKYGGLKLHFFELSVHHESNGQIVNSLDQYNSLLANKNHFVAENADDYLSISTNYLGLETGLKYHNYSFYVELRPLMYVDEDLPSFVRKDDFVKGGIWSARFFRFTTNLSYGNKNRKSVSFSIYRYAVEFAWQFIYFGNVPISLYAGTDNSNQISTYHNIDPYIRFGIDLK